MKSFKIFPIIAGLLLLISCDENWLEVKPADRLSEANFYKNEDHALRAITSCYDPLKHPRGFNINYYFVFETFGDRAIHEQINLNNMIINPSEGRVYDIWINLTQGIYRCNIAIEKIEGLKGNPGITMNENLKSRLIGEAKFLRALYNYYFTKIFGNPPLISQTEDDLDVQLKNATQAELFAFMEADLLDAINRLPASYDNANLGRATKGAAHTLLGKVYLFQHQFAKARDQFLAVKNLNIYQLMMPLGTDSTDYTAAFQCNFTGDDITTRTGRVYRAENNKESVFEIQFALGGWEIWEGGWQADGKLTTLFFGPEGYRNMTPTRAYVESFEAAPADHPAKLKFDPRKYVTFYMPGDSIKYVQNKKPAIRWRDRIHTNASITQGFGWGKYFKPTFWDESSNLNNDYNNIRVFRYSDVLLLLCEAEYLTNGSSELALESINSVRARAGMPALTEVTPQAIIHERDIEFGFEIKRYWDLVRWSKYPTPWVNITELIPVYNPVREGYLPIPIAEINLSRGSLKQNPGY